MIVDDFNNITGLRLDLHISRFQFFVENHLPFIISYYRGTAESLESTIQTELSSLTKESKRYREACLNHSRAFDNAEFWDVVDLIDEIGIRLKTIERTPRWVRSTVAALDRNINTEIDSVLESQHTLEDMARNHGYEDAENSWHRIAMRNDLDEEDYTIEGGNILKINIAGNISVVIDDVVDIMYGDNVYGKDIVTTIGFSNNDLNTVEGEACMIQCYETLIGLSKGDIPEHEDMGLSDVMGGNIAAFSYPTILRQVHRTMDRDDSIESVGISKFNTDGDIIVIDMIIESKFGKYIKKGIVL